MTISPGTPSSVRLPQSGFGRPLPVRSVRGASPLSESTASVRPGFEAAKFQGNEACAECPIGTIGALAISS